jgi:hypothetical protein
MPRKIVRDLIDSAADAIEEAIAWHTVAIVGGTGQRELQEIGTGSAISFDSQHFVLTARHVIADTPHEVLRFFCRPDGTFSRMPRNQHREQTAIDVDQLHLLERLPVLGRVLSDIDDLGVLVVDASLEQAHRVRFFDLDPAATMASEGQLVVAMGYPSDIARRIEGGNFVAFHSVEWSHVIVNRNLADYDPDRHFLTQYHMIEEDPSAHPRGFSGSGVWYRMGPTPDGKLWVPNLHLAGVYVTYFSQSQLLKAVRIERVIEFLRTVTSAA